MNEKTDHSHTVNITLGLARLFLSWEQLLGNQHTTSTGSSEEEKANNAPKTQLLHLCF